MITQGVNSGGARILVQSSIILKRVLETTTYTYMYVYICIYLSVYLSIKNVGCVCMCVCQLEYILVTIIRSHSMFPGYQIYFAVCQALQIERILDRVVNFRKLAIQVILRDRKH